MSTASRLLYSAIGADERRTDRGKPELDGKSLIALARGRGLRTCDRAPLLKRRELQSSPLGVRRILITTCKRQSLVIRCKGNCCHPSRARPRVLLARSMNRLGRMRQVGTFHEKCGKRASRAVNSEGLRFDRGTAIFAIRE